MRLLTLLLLSLSISFAQTIYVASASSMRPLMEELVSLFNSEHPEIDVKVSYGSSGSLYRQILGGAPYDLFISADELYPEKLVEHGRAYNPVVFAHGRLAVFSLDKDVKDFKVLGRARRVALANPRHAPYGRAALQFLKKEGLYRKLRGRLVYGSNVAQAFQFVVAGGADVGIVSLSLVRFYGKGSYAVVPRSMHEDIEHVAVITEKGRDKRGAREFLRFLKSEEARRVLLKFGFEVP
ncbi:molybdate ABC transporter substrate-binding protein [Hydrogenivirga sp.]